MSRVALSRMAGVVGLLLMIGTATLRIFTHIEGEGGDIGSPLASAVELVGGGAFAVVGIVLVLRRPENLIGWLLFLPIIGIFFNSYARYTLLANPDTLLPSGTIAAIIDVAIWTPFVFAVFLLLLTFPSGQVRGGRWLWATRLAGLAVVESFVATLLTSETLDAPYEGLANPLALGTLGPLEDIAFLPVLYVMLLVPVAAFDLIRRFRRSRGEERQQFRWLALSAGLVIGFFPVYVVLGSNADEVSYALFTVVLTTFPLSIGIAVLKYRLYDIDQILSRTLVYAILTASLGLIYLGLVVGLQAVFRPVSGNSDLAIALTTLIVAALFLPARQRIQQLVDRRFNRHVYDAARTIERFSARLRQNVELDALRYDLLSVVDETMEPARVSLWLRDAGPSR